MAGRTERRPDPQLPAPGGDRRTARPGRGPGGHHLDTRLWPDVPDEIEPTPEIVDAVVNSLRHTGFGRQYDRLGPTALREFLDEGVRRAIDLKMTDPRDARLIATRPRS